MAGDTKDVELRIRARDYSQKTLAQVADALDELTKAQDDQIAAAKRGETSAKSLEAAYTKIEQAAAALLKQGSLVKTYEQQSKVLQEVTSRVEELRVAQTKLARDVDAADKPTKEQVKSLKSLGTQLKAAEGAYLRQTDALAKTVGRLSEYGIATSDISSAQAKIVSSVKLANDALERQDAALSTLDSELQRHRKQVEETARAEKDLAAVRAQADDSRAAEARAAAEFEAQRKANIERNKRIAYEQQWMSLLDERERKENDLAAAQKVATAASEAQRAQREKDLATTKALADAEAKLQANLRQAADNAVAQSKGVSTLARPQQAAAGPDLSGTIRSIVDPAGEALKTLGGIEAAVGKLEQRANAATGPVKGFKAALQEVAATQRSVAAIAGQVDAYERQVQALRRARTEYVGARAEVAALAAQMRSGTGGEELVRQMSAAQSKLATMAAAMGQQVTRTRELRDGLRAAGVATNDIAATQAGLQAAAERSVAATQRLTNAVRQYGAAADDTDKKAKAWSFLNGTGERTTLSYMQRLRGEVLAMGTAFVGLQAAANLAKGAIDVTLANAKIQNRLSVLFEGDTSKATAEFEYLRNMSNQLKVSFETAAQGYTKFAIGAKQSGFTLQEIRYTFENITLAARNAGLSNEEYEGTLKAVEQMMSKGVIQAEELKGQLGDRLPGAVAILAQSMGKTTGELLKMMETGGVTARYVLNLAAQLGDTYNKTQDTAATRLMRAVADQENAARAFKEAVADSGFIEAYTAFLTKLSALLKSPEGKQLAQELGTAFTVIVEIGRVAAENVGLLKAALIGLAAIKGGAVVGSLITGFGVLRAGVAATRVEMAAMSLTAASAGAAGGPIAAMTRGVGMLTLAFRALRLAIPVIGIAYAAYEAGSFLYDKYKEDEKKKVEKMGARVGTEKGRGTMTDLTANPGTQVNSDDQQLEAVKNALKKGQGKVDTRDKASRMSAAKGELEERIRIATEEHTSMRKLAEEGIKDEAKRGEAVKAIDAQIAQIRATETRNFNREQARSGAGAVNQRLKLATDLAQGLDNLANKTADKEAQLDPNATFEDRMKARKAIAADTYDQIEKKLTQLDALTKGDPAAAKAVNKILGEKGISGGLPEARKLVVSGRTAAEDAAGKEAAQKEVGRLEKRLSEGQDALTRKLEAEQAIYEAGAQTQAQMLDNRAKLNREYATSIGDSASSLEKFATQYRALLDPAAYEALIARVTVLRAKLQPGKTDLQERLTAQEKALNEQLDRRTMLLSEIESKAKTGEITSADAAARTNAVYAQFKPVVNGNIDTLNTYIEGLLQTKTLSDEQVAALEKMRAKFAETRREINSSKQAFADWQQVGIDSASSGLTSGISSVSDSLGGMITGQKSVSEGFKEIGTTAATTFAKILQDIGAYIIKMQIANALAGSENRYLQAVGTQMGGKAAASTGTAVAGGATTAVAGAAATTATPAADALVAAAAQAGTIQTAAATTAAVTTQTAAVTTAATDTTTAATTAAVDTTTAAATAATDAAAAATFAGTVVTAGTTFATAVMAAAQAQAATAAFHVGGVVGGGGSGMSRTVSPGIFSSAQRFHSGGIPGLSRNEVPAVLMKGEEVLTRNDPRHVLNGGGGATGGQSKQESSGNRFVLVDDRAKVHEAMASAEGEQVTMVHLRRNLPAIKQLLR